MTTTKNGIKCQNIQELTSLLKKHLMEKQYSKSSLKTYGCLLDRFTEYCEQNSIETYSPEMGRQYVWDQYGIVLGEHDSGKNVCRMIHMLTDFSRYGMIFKQQNVRKEGFSIAFSRLFEDFLLSLEKNLVAPSSIQKYRNFLFRFENYLIHRGVLNFSRLELHHINAYIESLAGLSQNTIAASINNLKRLMDYANANGYHHTSYSNSLPTVTYSKSNRLPHTFTVEETDRILANIDTGNPLGKRNYAVILIASRLGLRVSDIINLKFKNIDWELKLVSVIQQKTNEPLSFEMPNDVFWAIVDYLKYGRPETDCKNIFVRHIAPYDNLSSCFQKEILRAVQKAGIKIPSKKIIGMHTFRHSLATSLLDKGVPLSTISQILGLKNEDSTESYINLSLKNLRECALEVELI